MIILIPIYKNYPALENIASWRNSTLYTLRATCPTSTEQYDWIEFLDNETEKYYFIAKDNTEPQKNIIGYCGLDKISNTNKTAEISLLINPYKQGNGYGSEAVRKLLEISFEGLGLNCIFAECYTTINTWEFWKKCGFKKEGHLRVRKFWQGKYYDSIIGSILRSEWQQND